MNVIQHCRHGLMSFNTNDQVVGKSLEFYGEYCEEVVRILTDLCEPGYNVVDVGAHIGAITIPLAKKIGSTGSLLAFEPQRHLYYTLCGNVVLNNLNHVLCIQNAIGATEGRIEVPELNLGKLSDFGSMGLRREWPPGTFKVSVKLTPLDNFKLPKLNLLKITAEGMEREVLLGAEETIQRCRPFLYIDSHDEENAFAILSLARNQGYELFFHTPPYFREQNEFASTTNIFGNMFTTSLFGYPKELSCPVDLTSYGLRPVNEGRKVILMSDERSTDRTIEQNRSLVVDGLCKMADATAELKYNSYEAMGYLHQAFSLMTVDDPNLILRACPILTRHRRYEEALNFADVAWKISKSSEAAYSKAVILGALDRPLESIEYYRKVLETNPDHAEVHFNLAYDLLKSGQYEEGWKEYEWRFKRRVPTMKEFMRKLETAPTWDGKKSLVGKKILLYMEQGAGDHIQMCRYAKTVKSLGAEVIMATFPGLTRLMKMVNGVDRVVEITPNLSLAEEIDYDFTCSLMSLPRLFGSSVDNLPAPVRYIVPERSGKFDAYLNDRHSYKVGFAWCGSETHMNDFTRSMPLKHLQPLWDVENITLVNLQLGPQKRLWPCGPVDLSEDTKGMDSLDLTCRFNDFNDTAEVIDKLDAVICVDTSIAHLAAAMGKRVYLLLWMNSDWRWLTGTATPWYPTVEIFRGKNWYETVSKAVKAIRDNSDYFMEALFLEND